MQQVQVPRIAYVNSKTSDLNNIKIGDHVHDGYVPDDMNLCVDRDESYQED